MRGSTLRGSTSHDIMLRYDAREVDAAIVRKDGRRKDGELLFEDKFGWFAAVSRQSNARGPLRLISLTDDCGMRAIAIKSLQAARIDWVDAFIGGGIAATAAATVAGLGIAPMAHRVAPAGTREVGTALGLPPLPTSRVMLYTRVADHRTKGTLRMLTAAFRAPSQN